MEEDEYERFEAVSILLFKDPKTLLELQTDPKASKHTFGYGMNTLHLVIPMSRSAELVSEIVDRVAWEDTNTALEPPATSPRNPQRNYTSSMRTWILRRAHVEATPRSDTTHTRAQHHFVSIVLP